MYLLDTNKYNLQHKKDTVTIAQLLEVIDYM